MSTTSYQYDLNGNQTQKTLPNGTVETRVYDERNRVTQVKTALGAIVQSQFDYSYDGAGNVTGVSEAYALGTGLPGRTIVNDYDSSNRLEIETITVGLDTVETAYDYDFGHNRTTKTVTVNSGTPQVTSYAIGDGSLASGAGANQVVSITPPSGPGISFGYDGNGNRTTKTIGSNTDNYTYDYENRLAGLSKVIGGTGSFAYAYDYRSRRVTRTELGATTQVVFSGGTSIQETGASSVEYVRGPGQGGGVGGLEYSVRNGAALTNQYNSRGDVIGQSDSTGLVACQAVYDAFGSQATSYGSTPDRQKANTKDQDPTGLINYGFRYRDPETGTFITRDPMGLAAGPNGYIYCGQNPWSRFDPTGLLEQESQQIVNDINNLIQARDQELNYFYNEAKRDGQWTNSTSTGYTNIYHFYRTRILGDIYHIDEIEAKAQGARALLYENSYGVGKPGFWGGLLPIYGSGRTSINDYQHGRWGWGTFNAGMAISDAFLVKALFVDAGKFGWRAFGSNSWRRTSEWLNDIGYRDFPGQVAHHWLIPQGGEGALSLKGILGEQWGRIVPKFVKNQPWNLMKMPAEAAFHQALHGNGILDWSRQPLMRIFFGTPGWAKTAAGTGLFSTFGRGLDYSQDPSPSLDVAYPENPQLPPIH